MGEVRATSVSDLAGTGPVDLTGQSAAKVWARYDASSVVSDSFNVSSTVDGATTGQTTVNFTNNMSDSNYAAIGTCNGTTGDRFATISNQTTSSYDTFTYDATVRSDQPVGTLAAGDLA